MKYSKILLSLCVLLFLVSISMVSANEMNTTEIYESSTSDATFLDNQENSYANSFSDLNNKIAHTDKNYISLSEDYKYNSTSDNSYNEGIIIKDNNITINGNGHTINANNESRIFNITGKNIILKNINFVNALTQFNGSAIYSESPINILNCTFQNNHADECGGAIFIEGNCSNNLIESTFINNSAENGGAIYFKGTVTNTKITGLFKNNTAERAGGAIYFKKDARNNQIKSDFQYNIAEQASGGAMFFHHPTENNNFKSTFKYNVGFFGAGMFFYNKTNNNIFNSDFRYNTAISCAGAMFFHNTTKNNKFYGYFLNNTGYIGNGGAITFKDTSRNSYFLCDFINNTAGEYGGGVNFRQTPYNITFNSNFINNKAEYGGGVNFFENMENLTFNGEFINNTAVYGGGICVQNASIENTSFINNKAKDGGAIYTNGTTKINNIQFINNSADNGGAIENNNGTITVNKSTFNNNNATEGGAIYNKGNATFTNNIFNGNTANMANIISTYNNVTFIASDITTDNLENMVKTEEAEIFAYNNTVNNEFLEKGLINSSITLTSDADDFIINKEHDITGTLIDATNIPIANKTVELYVNRIKQGTSLTDDNGYFAFKFIPTSGNNALIKVEFNPSDYYLRSSNEVLVKIVNNQTNITPDNHPTKDVPSKSKHITHSITGYSNDLQSRSSHVIKLVDDNRVVYTGNTVTIETLNNIFNINFVNGHLTVYIDGQVVFNDTVTGDLNKIIFEIIASFLGNHELKIEFTDVNNNTQTFVKNITIE